jgi:hypothetical protein
MLVMPCDILRALGDMINYRLIKRTHCLPSFLQCIFIIITCFTESIKYDIIYLCQKSNSRLLHCFKRRLSHILILQ